MQKLMDVSDQDVATIEDVIKERLALGVSQAQAQRQAVDEALAQLAEERAMVMRAVDEQLGRGTNDAVTNPNDVVGNQGGRSADDTTPGTVKDIAAAWDALGIKNAIFEKNGTIELSRIEVPAKDRNSGIGTKAMQQLLDYADSTGQRITLTPSSDFGGNKGRLVDFYKAMGFKENKGRSRDFTTRDTMIREPKLNESTAPDSGGAHRNSVAQAPTNHASPVVPKRSPEKMTVTKMRSALDRRYPGVMDGLESKGLLRLVQTHDDALTAISDARAQKLGGDAQAIRQALMGNYVTQGDGALALKRSTTGVVQAFYDPVTGQAFMVSDAMTMQTAPGVLMHEVGIHMAADGAMKPVFERASQLLKMGRGNDFLSRVQERMDMAGETSGEEAAAYITEEYENDPGNAPDSVKNWIASLYAAIRAWMFRKGVLITADHLTPADIAAVARANAKAIAEDGQAAGGEAGWNPDSYANSVAAIANAELTKVGERVPVFSSLEIDPATGDVFSRGGSLLEPEGEGLGDSVPVDGGIGTDQSGGGRPRNLAELEMRLAASKANARRSDGGKQDVAQPPAGDSDSVGDGAGVSRYSVSDSELARYLASVGGGFESHGVGVSTLKRALITRDHSGTTVPGLLYSRAAPAATQPTTWKLHSKKGDGFIQGWRDGRVDLKRAQESIEAFIGKEIPETADARLAETLYAGRVADRSQAFLRGDVKPLMELMHKQGIDQLELSDYMLARHAPERNAQIAKVNPNMPDGGAGTNSKGVLMTTQAAKDYIANLSAGQRIKLDLIAKRVDAITQGTRQLLVDEGLESQETIDAWQGAYKHYAPLFKDEAEEGMYSHPTGSGFTVKGSASERAMGSEGEVTNMLAHVLQQREAAITRAEKNRVLMSLYALALENPNPEFFTVVRPNMSESQIAKQFESMGIDWNALPIQLRWNMAPDAKEQLRKDELATMGINPDATASMVLAPSLKVIDKATGQVRSQVNPMYKNLPNALVLKVAGQDRVILFNAKNEQALRLVENLRNMDGPTIDALNQVGHVTRFMASMATQYNPVFGIANVTRDVQGALVNLSSTPLAGKQLQVMMHLGTAGKGIAADLYTDGKSQDEWAKLYRQFREDGGQTGYMDQVRDPFERTKAIAKELENLDRSKAHPARVGRLVLGAINGWNTTLENAVRLSVYKVALDAGHSRAKSAKMAREITVDFNRKGANMKYISPLYAFANASIQGTARTLETLSGPKGKAIIAGGLAIGVLQAMVLAAAGYDDDEIPEYDKARSLIFPLGVNEEGKKEYFKLPLPLGLHILPNTGRVATELAMSDGKDARKKVWRAMGEIASAFNPLGGGDITTRHGFLTTFAPTAVDPVIDLIENKSFSGNSISKERFSDNDMRPGHRMAKESTLKQPSGEVYTGIAKAINKVTGGNDYRKGDVSLTPEEVRYAIMAVGGGLLREIEKGTNASIKASQDKDVKINEIPLAGRFFGDVDPDQVQQSRYFENRNKVEKLASELQQLKKGKKFEERDALRESNPLSGLVRAESMAQRRIGEINRKIIENIDDAAEVKKQEQLRIEKMRKFNARVLDAEKAAQKAAQ